MPVGGRCLVLDISGLVPGSRLGIDALMRGGAALANLISIIANEQNVFQRISA
jgi:hypothetical protein